MRTVLLKLAYDGTDFEGYQLQARGRTVQGVVEQGLSQLHGHPVRIVAAGRTDSGVHATGQYVSFVSDHSSLPIDRFVPAINSVLPPDVSALCAREVPDGFHARYDALRRHYRYRLIVSPVAVPHLRRYAYRIPEQPRLMRMNLDAAALVGRHDFTTFAARRDESQQMERTVFYADFRPTAGGIEFGIAADGFLWHMVRSIVGTIVERERLRLRGLAAKPSMAALLAARDRRMCGTTAPAWGLYLHDVDYEIDGGVAGE